MRFIALLALVACDPSETAADFEGGEFTFETIGVTDACYDGAFESIFLPEGAGSTNEFATGVYVPGADELPSTYTIDLQPPFDAMEVTVEGDEASRVITGAENTDVELDADQWPGCLVDASIDVDLVVDSADEVHGTAVLHTSSFDEDSCPEVGSDPCDITLDIRGTRN